MTRDLDVIGIGMMMAEISPPRAGMALGDAAEVLTLLPSGSATIFVTAAAALGARVGFISRVGADDLGRWMVGQLCGCGVDVSAVGEVDGQLTPVALASVDTGGAKTFAFYRFPGLSDPLSTLTSAEIPDSYLSRAAVFDLTEGSLRSALLRDASMDLARRAKTLGASICFNPNYRAGSWMGGEAEAVATLRAAFALADLAVMNDAEARMISGRPDTASALRWMSEQGLPVAAVTSGGEAVHVLDRGAIRSMPVPPAQVVFDVGAGDVFRAGFVAEWRRGIKACRYAQFATA
ncbi:MAG: carbohydrate kinase family protein, partial [Thermomicrobiales bacterium]